jgi:hypothetical protein
MTVGQYVFDGTRALGLGYHDFIPYLREHGWFEGEGREKSTEAAD